MFWSGKWSSTSCNHSELAYPSQHRRHNRQGTEIGTRATNYRIDHTSLGEFKSSIRTEDREGFFWELYLLCSKYDILRGLHMRIVCALRRLCKTDRGGGSSGVTTLQTLPRPADRFLPARHSSNQILYPTAWTDRQYPRTTFPLQNHEAQPTTTTTSILPRVNP
jgi:hypothetical protein